MRSTVWIAILVLSFGVGVATGLAQWKLNQDTRTARCFLRSNSVLYAGTNFDVLRSDDFGEVWTPYVQGIEGNDISSLALADTNLLVGTGDAGVFLLSTLDTVRWQEVNLGIEDKHISAVASIGKSFYAATLEAGVFRSIDNCASWQKVNTGLPTNWITSLTVSGSKLIVGTATAGVFLSADSGRTWIDANGGLTNPYVVSLASFGATLFAGTDYGGGIFRSTDLGAHWSCVRDSTHAVYSLVVTDGAAFAGTGGDGVLLTTNGGLSWRTVNEGLPLADVRSLGVAGKFLFVSVYDGGIWRRPLSEMLTPVQDPATTLPTQLALDQNFPNPFNPTTKISFAIPTQSFASLKISDALGREAAVLVSEVLSPGTYLQEWDATAFSSGIYFCRLQAGGMSETRKLVLTK